MDGWSSPPALTRARNRPALGCTHARVRAGPASPLVLLIDGGSCTCPRRRVSVSPADSLLLGCFHLSWDVLFIALTLYFEVLPRPGWEACERNTLLPVLHSLDLGTGSSGRVPLPEWQRGPRDGVILPIWGGERGDGQGRYEPTFLLESRPPASPSPPSHASQAGGGLCTNPVPAPNPPAASWEVRTRGGPPPSQHSVHLHLPCAVNVISGLGPSPTDLLLNHTQVAFSFCLCLHTHALPLAPDLLQLLTSVW